MGRRWAVLLGASSGFGAAAARAFAAEGYGIFGAPMDRRGGKPAVEALIEELRAHDVPVVFHNGNAASDDVRAEALAALGEAMGEGDTVGVLLHSLAFGTLRPFFGERGTIGRKHMDMTLDVMAHSLVYWAQDLVAAGHLTRGARIYARRGRWQRGPPTEPSAPPSARWSPTSASSPSSSRPRASPPTRSWPGSPRRPR